MSHTYAGPDGYNPATGTVTKGRSFSEGDMPPELWEQWLEKKWLVKTTVAKTRPMEDVTDG